MRKNKIIIITLGLILSAGLLTACSSKPTKSSSSSTPSKSSSTPSKSSSTSKSSSSSSKIIPSSSSNTNSTGIKSITTDNLTDASAQILAAWAINKLDIKDEKPTFQVFTGTTDTIYLLNTGSSGTNGSKDISDIMKSSCRILLNSDNMYTLEVLDSEVSNAMSQNPFGAGPWKTVQAQSMDELNSSYSSQIGNISISISSEADPAVLAN